MVGNAVPGNNDQAIGLVQRITSNVERLPVVFFFLCVYKGLAP